MRRTICRVALATALAIFLIGSTGTARADDSAWKAAYDTDPHLPLTPEQVEMTAGKRAGQRVPVDCRGGHDVRDPHGRHRSVGGLGARVDHDVAAALIENAAGARWS